MTHSRPRQAQAVVMGNNVTAPSLEGYGIPSHIPLGCGQLHGRRLAIVSSPEESELQQKGLKLGIKGTSYLERIPGANCQGDYGIS